MGQSKRVASDSVHDVFIVLPLFPSLCVQSNLFCLQTLLFYECDTLVPKVRRFWVRLIHLEGRDNSSVGLPYFFSVDSPLRILCSQREA